MCICVSLFDRLSICLSFFWPDGRTEDQEEGEGRRGGGAGETDVRLGVSVSVSVCVCVYVLISCDLFFESMSGIESTSRGLISYERLLSHLY